MEIEQERAMSGAWIRKTTFRRVKEASFCVRFTPDDRLVFSAHYDGTVVGYEVNSGNLKFEMNGSPKPTTASASPQKRLPITSLAIRPTGKQLLLLGMTNGCVDRWDMRGSERVSSIQEPGNEIYAVDYRSDGHLFATCGLDATVRVYDDSTGDIIRSYRTAPEYPANPSPQRMYSLKFSPEDPNLIVAGGWGNTIYVFDIRAETPMKELFGPCISGDSLDMRDGVIVSAAQQLDSKLQFWTLDSEKPTNVEWPTQNNFLPMCAKFSQDPQGFFVAVGGGGGNGLKDAAFVLDRRSNRLVVDSTFEFCVNSCHFAHKENLVAFGDGGGNIHLFEGKVRK